MIVCRKHFFRYVPAIIKVFDKIIVTNAAPRASPSPPRTVQEYYSTYHKTPDRQPLSSNDYKATDMTGEAVGDLVRSRDFQEWWANNVVSNNRVSIAPNEHREERPEEEVEATASLPEDDFILSKNNDHPRRYPGKR